MNIKIHYASIDLGLNDIPVFEFDKVPDAFAWMGETFLEKGLQEARKKVYLISFVDNNGDENGWDHVFVSEYFEMVVRFWLDMGHPTRTGNENMEIFLQEYPSFEDAYAVALTMKEGVSELALNQPTT